MKDAPSPRFKLEENIPSAAGEFLRQAAYDVETVLSEGLGGAVDYRVIEASRTEGRILVTLDLDFADIRSYPPASHAGVWVLRPDQQKMQSIVALLQGAIKLLPKEPTGARLWVVEKERVRIRE